MHLNLEAADQHTISGYSTTHILIKTEQYHTSTLVARELIVPNWPVQQLQDLDLTQLAPALDLKPEIILIGHQLLNSYLPLPVLQALSQQRIGIECMSIGAACRTFNVLLSEQRAVVLGVIFS